MRAAEDFMCAPDRTGLHRERRASERVPGRAAGGAWAPWQCSNRCALHYQGGKLPQGLRREEEMTRLGKCRPMLSRGGPIRVGSTVQSHTTAARATTGAGEPNRAAREAVANCGLHSRRGALEGRSHDPWRSPVAAQQRRRRQRRQAGTQSLRANAAG